MPLQSLNAGGSHREPATAGSAIQEPKTGRRGQGSAAGRLRAVAAILLTLAATTPPGYAQQEGTATAPPDNAASDLPVAPVPVATQPIPLRTSDRDYSKAFGTWHGNPINIYRPTTIAKASFANSVRLADLVKDGKIYLSLSDAIALAIENNYDIAAGRAFRPDHGNPRRFHHHFVHGRRPGRLRSGLRRCRFRCQRSHALHTRRGPSAGVSGSHNYRHRTTGTGQIAADQHFQPGLLHKH